MLDIARRFVVPILVALSLVPGVAAACSCTNELTLEEEFEYARTVFSGRVLAIQPSAYDANQVLVFFQPLERWKGPLDHVAEVYTPVNEGVCGYPFVVGQDYLVFTTLAYVGITYTPAHYTHACARTSPLPDNIFVPSLPAPLVPTKARPATWGSVKLHYR